MYTEAHELPRAAVAAKYERVFTKRRTWSELQFPALAKYRLDELSGLGVIGEALGFGVPLEFPRNVQRDGDQSQPLGVRGGDAEVGTSGVAALTGADPIQHVAGGPGQQLRGQHVFGPSRRGQ